MEAEGLRLGMFLAGALMALFPVLIGGALIVLLLKEYRKERGRGREDAPAASVERS